MNTPEIDPKRLTKLQQAHDMFLKSPEDLEATSMLLAALDQYKDFVIKSGVPPQGISLALVSFINGMRFYEALNSPDYPMRKTGQSSLSHESLNNATKAVCFLLELGDGVPTIISTNGPEDPVNN